MRPKFASFSEGRTPDIAKISGETLATFLNRAQAKDYLLIDARFDYEYSGGHIINAQQVCNTDKLCQLLQSYSKPPTIIFYCEFSQQRSVALYRWLRGLDRTNNTERYPELTYPDMFILDGGYSRFFENYPSLCTPIGYISMDDPLFKQEKKEMKRNTH